MTLVVGVGDGARTHFHRFCLDLANERVWRGSQAIKLRPEPFALLVNHRGLETADPREATAPLDEFS